jgi:hypothetical protein
LLLLQRLCLRTPQLLRLGAQGADIGMRAGTRRAVATPRMLPGLEGSLCSSRACANTHTHTHTHLCRCCVLRMCCGQAVLCCVALSLQRPAVALRCLQARTQARTFLRHAAGTLASSQDRGRCGTRTAWAAGKPCPPNTTQTHTCTAAAAASRTACRAASAAAALPAASRLASAASAAACSAARRRVSSACSCSAAAACCAAAWSVSARIWRMRELLASPEFDSSSCGARAAVGWHRSAGRVSGRACGLL